MPRVRLLTDLQRARLRAKLVAHSRWLKGERGGKLRLINQSFFDPDIFVNADLRDADFEYCDFSGSNFSGADLTEAYFRCSSVRCSSFVGANLTEAEMVSCDVSDACFSRADLTGARFHLSNLTYAHLHGAKMKDTRFVGSCLTSTSFPQSYPVFTLTLGWSWPVTVYKDVTSIGCQTHPNAKWLKWGPKNVAHMHKEAYSWWKLNSGVVKAAIRRVMTKTK